MNDRYLYRAKRTDNGEWVEGYIVKYGFTNREKFYIVPEYASDLYGFEVDRSTICQCTGLKDKHGKLIWENDIVKDNVILGSVSRDDITARFVIDDIHDGYQDYSDWWSEVEVIGNSFDNPELLEVDTE